MLWSFYLPIMQMFILITTMPYNVHHSLVTLLSYGSLYSGAQICMLVTTAPFSMLL